MLGKKLMLEGIWLILTDVIIVIIMLPIYTYVGGNYLFYKENIAIIFLSVTYIRYIFLTKHHWISESKIFKVLFMAIPIPIFFFLVGSFYAFQAYSDEVGLSAMVSEIHYRDQAWICKYMRVQFVFFFAAAFISNALMPIRMLVSIWREINKGTH